MTQPQQQEFRNTGSATLPFSRHSRDAHNTFFGHFTFREKNDRWNTVIKNKLNDLCALPKGWDGYNGISTKFEVANFAHTLLERVYNENTPVPSIVPLSNGGIQIEWHVNNLDIEIAIRKPYSATVWIDDLNGQDEPIEEELTNDFSLLIPWIKKLG